MFDNFPCAGDASHFIRDGWEITVKILADDDIGLLSDLGEFSDDWRPGALNHHRLQGHRGYPNRECRWFHPSTTVADHRADMSRTGTAKQEAEIEARKYVCQDYERARSYGEDWCFLGISVTVSKEGVTLADDSQWGIESDGGEAYITECVEDVIPEVIDAAKKNLQMLCECA